MHLTIRGTRLHVELRGREDAAPLLYLHGGPGSGSYDFEVFQSEKLVSSVRLVMLDQRGTLRSDPIADSDAFGLDDLVLDCEALRQALDIPLWSVLGHSFGGYIAVCYALTFPTLVDRLIFENPTFDLDLSARSLLRAAAHKFQTLGDEARATRCFAVAVGAQDARRTWVAFTELTNALGPERNSLYVHNIASDFFDHLVANSPFPVEWWARGSIQQRRLFEEGRVFQSLLPCLPQITQPALLIKGGYDHVTSVEQLQAFREAVPRQNIVFLGYSGHFPRAEEPDVYAHNVAHFVCERVSSEAPHR